MFKNPFSFKGRIRRTEYGFTLIAYFVVALTLQYIILAPQLESGEGSLLYFIIFIPIFWIMLAQGCKRCHDRGNTGWFQIIPFYGFWMLFADSISGENEYGPNPKGIGNVDEVDAIGDYLKR
jgi:uncharacterized membrane protein YhaH (DUF805 family)